MERGTCGKNLTWTLEDGTLIISGTGAMENYYYTTEVPQWCNFRKSIRKVILNDGVTTIGSQAFYYCASLKEIRIPRSVNLIGDCSFQYCENLTSITIPDGVTEIGGGVFYDCKSLTELKIPDSVTKINNSTFSGCTSLTSITIPESVTKILLWAFAGCTSLTSITIPDSVTLIADRAFIGCTNLMNIKMPMKFLSGACGENLTWKIDNGILRISGSGAMHDYSSEYYSSEISAPWYNRSDLIKIAVIDDGVTTIGKSAFWQCFLKSVIIPDSVISIGEEAD